MIEQQNELELLRRNGRLRNENTRPLDWSNLTALSHERMAFIYPRLSTHEQRDRSVWSIERQRWLEELARLDGYEVPLSKEDVEAIRDSADYPGWYQNGQIVVDERDLGISGTLGRQGRLGIDHLIDMIESGRVESVYTVEVSRLWRDKSLTGDRSLRRQGSGEHGIDVDDALRFGRLCRERNVILVMPHMRLNLNDRMHWRIYRTEAERAAEELELMQYRLGGARAMKARQGFHPGGPSIPVGYMLDTDRTSPTYQKLIPYEPHAAVVRLIFARFVAAEGSAFAVVNWCRREGVRLAPLPPELAAAMKGRWAFFRKESGPDGWPVTVHLVRSMITNPKYIGWWIYKGEIVSRDNHPAIVEEPTFWAAASLASSDVPQRRGRAADQPRPLLSGLLYCCNHAGEPRRLSGSGGRGRQWYSCHRDYRNGEGDQQCLAVANYILERPITDFVTAQCSYPEYVSTVLQRLESENEQQRAVEADHQRQRRALQQELTTLQANCQTLLTSEHYTPERHADLEQLIAQKRSQLRDLDAAGQRPRPILGPRQVAMVRQFLANIQTEWPRLSLELQREFLARIVLDRVLLRHDKERIWCRLMWRTGGVREIVIRRPYVDERTPWTAEEEAILRTHFYEAPVERLQELLPQRTWVGISRHAWSLGLERTKDHDRGRGTPKRRWEQWETDLIRQYYDAQLSKDELQAVLPHRHWGLIKTKANRMGLRWVERQPWESRLRWEEVPAGALDQAPNDTTVLLSEGPRTPCRRAPSSRSPSRPSAGSPWCTSQR